MDFKDRKQTARELTSYIVHKHYCENDSGAIVALFGEPFSWFGAGEHEYAVGREKVAGIVRQFKGMVPKCNISDEEYEVLELTPDMDDSALTCLGVACFDLNELKAVNDCLGHSAGDDLIRRTAGHIKAAFSHMAYRIGGGEFVVIGEIADVAVFRSSIDSIRHHMKKDQINVSIGIPWRSSGCSLKEQFDEADYLMYQEKARFYADHNRDRRRKLI